MSHDAESTNLQHSIHRAKLDRSATLSLEQRLREGADLFDDSMRWIRSLIQAQHPEYSAQDIEREIERRKQISKRIDDAGLYRTCRSVNTNDDQ